MPQFKRPDKQSIIIFLLLLITVGAVCVTVWALFFRTEEAVLTPDHAPVIEKQAQPIPGDTGEPDDAQPGSGSVSLTYSNLVKINLGDQSAQFLFANPGRSNQDMVVQLVIQDRIIFQSGRIMPGNQVRQLALSADTVAMLMPGCYEGMFLIHFYDPVSGEKAIVTTEIPVTVTVAQ